MTAKKNADIFKLIYLTIFIILLLQLVSFLFFKYFDFSLNQQMVFGLVGSNFTACLTSIIIFVILIYLYFRKVFGLEIILILAGLLSNLLDRAVYGGVLDYLSLFFIPKFNLADVLIVTGALILAYRLIRTI